MRFVIPLLVGVLLLSGCKTPIGEPDPTALPGTPEFFEEQREICEAKGGRFGNVPGGKTKLCFITPSDANQGCLQGSDCEGVCLARSRSCAPVIPLYGCNEVLLEGGRPATVCRD